MAQTTSRPGALDTGTVNLSTGAVSFPVNLASLPGRNGLDFNLSIQYSSVGIREMVDTWTREAPTGLLGLGWSFPQERIMRSWNGDTRDSTYAIYTQNTLYPLVKCGTNGAEGDIYESTNYQFWKIRYQPEFELWTITKEDGTCYSYGGNAHQTGDAARTSAGNSVEWGVQWGSWSGPGNAVEKQEQFPVAWNLACIEDIWGNYVTLEYEQDQQLVGTRGARRKNYTQACRLSQVIGVTGESILLHYGPEAGMENPYEKRVKSHQLPGGGEGPDAYQDQLERHYLDSLEVLNAQGHLMSHVQLHYASLGSGQMQKQILKSLKRSNTHGQPYEPPTLFAYYGETSADGVSVSPTDASQVAHGGALFGALKSVTSPQGATTAYQYTEMEISSALRDLDIPCPGSDWHHPLTYPGPDYTVIIWRSKASEENNLHISAYQWLGQWVANKPTILTVDKKNIEHIQVELATTFFAVITPGQEKAIHLFSKDPLSFGKWEYTAQYTGASTNCLIASGSTFFALLDQTSGKLSCYTQDGKTWKDFEEQLPTGQGTFFGLTARNNYICTVSTNSGSTAQPELRLYALDALGNWREPIRRTGEAFFKDPATHVGHLSLVGSTTFVSLLVSGSYKLQNHSYPDHRLLVYHWTDTTIEAEPLSIFPEAFSLYDDSVGLDIVDHMMIVRVGHQKVAYQHDGERWHSRIFKNDSEMNNYIGNNSFSTTEDGLAQFRQFNPNTGEWDDGNIPAYKDGNPTLAAKIWSLLSPLLDFVTLPLDGPAGVLIFFAMLTVDYVLASTPERLARGAKRFFTGNNLVYHQDTTGTWKQIGELLTAAEGKPHPVPNNPNVQETYTLDFQNTQVASNFIACALTRVREVPGQYGNLVPAPDSPAYVTKVQLLKNGGFRSSAHFLDEKESIHGNPADETGLIGWDTFLTFQGATLREATSLRLYRVTQDGFQGPLKDDVVSMVSVDDGYEKTYVHYLYDLPANCLPIGTTVLYSHTTTVYSGSAKHNFDNGFTESYCYTGGDTTYLENLPPDQAATNASLYPSLVAGYPYYTRVYNGQRQQISATTYYWRVFERSLHDQTRGYYLRQVKSVSESDGSHTVAETNYDHQHDLDNGLPAKTITYNTDVTGHEEKLETSYRYGWEIDPQFRTRHILAPTIQTMTRVNGIETKNQVTTWLPAPRNPFQLTPGKDLPPQFQGTGWSAIDAQDMSTTARCPFPLGIASTRWEPTIPTLTLVSPFFGKMTFTYCCDITANGGWTWAELEVRVDGSKVWESGRTNQPIAETIAIDLPRSYQRIEWRVISCGVEVERAEQGHHTNHDASVIVSVRDIRMPGLHLQAPATTYQAQKPVGWTLPGDTDPNWLKTSTITARNPAYGVVTETQDVNKTTSSVIYDTNYRFPVARFVHASVEKHEAGYYGFEDYEDETLWHLTGTPDEDVSTHSGQKAYSGKDVRIEPRAFTPRAELTPYIVSAWVKTRSGGTGTRIGFGESGITIGPGKDNWQYVECMTRIPDTNQKPFAICDGAIDNFRFGPVDAPFSATVYDPLYHLVTEQLGTNGETVRFIYDDLQTLIATTGPDGTEVNHLMIEKHSRDEEKGFEQTRPNHKLTLLPRNGGRYYRTLSDYPGYKEAHADYIGGPVTYVSQRVTPPAANYGFKLRVSAPINRRNQSFFGMAFGSRVVRCDADHTVKLTSVMPKAYPGQVLKSFTPDYDPLDGSEWMLIVLGQRAFFFLDGDLLFSETFTESQYRLVLLWGPDEANIAGSDVFLFADPIVELKYTDGLDRLIQTIHLDQYAEGTIARQILYDGWSHPAVITKPLHTPEISLAYQSELVKTFDWKSGKMTGQVVDYYAQASVQVPAQKADDASYPYSRQIAEMNPLARICEITQPGVDFKAGSLQTVQTNFGRTTEANALLADLNLTDKAGNYTLVTTRYPFEGQTRAVATQLFDQQGNLIASRQGSGAAARTSTRHFAYTSDNTRTVTSNQPKAFPYWNEMGNHRYNTTTTINFAGRPQEERDSDRNTEQYICDPAGRLRFKLDREGATQNPQRILYWSYDAFGRILAEGILHQQWNREQLQQVADGPIPGEDTSANWTRRYVYDMSGDGVTTNLKGRLAGTVTRSKDIHGSVKMVREFFAYDLAGNLAETQLIVEAFDAQIRVTRYEYDGHGNITRITYPHNISSQPDFDVHYRYNINGQIAHIGTADAPDRYATYVYNPDGRVVSERLNNQYLQYDHTYDFQGRLLDLKDQQGIFAEELSYRDSNGTFKDGNVTSATFTGSALNSPHGYAYQYDDAGRLIAAHTLAAKAGMVPHPDWDLQKIEYDENGNLLHMQQGQASSTYQYTLGTNQIKGLQHNSTNQPSFGFEASELEHFHLNTEPQIFGDWYAKGLEGGISTEEKHSGTQSYRLGREHVLLSKIHVTPESTGYLCSGWLKIPGSNQEVGIQIKTSLNGSILAEQRVPSTGDGWQSFQCTLPDAGKATELFAVILQTKIANPPLPIYIDDVTFGPLKQDVYEHNPNGWITKSGEVDAVNYDPHAALPVDIHTGNQHTHLFYGGRRQRVVKTTTTGGQNAPLEQRLYVHGASAYPLVEYTRTGRTCYIYGPGGLIAQSEDAQMLAFFLKDHLGSTRVVVNEENQPMATFNYLPFGSLISDNSSSQEAIQRFRYLFTGQEYDQEIGLHNYRARMYGSDLGRFLTPDPKRQFPSPYVYVNNNPLNFTDPTGEMLRLFSRTMRTAPRYSRGMKQVVINNGRVWVAENKDDALQILRWGQQRNRGIVGTGVSKADIVERIGDLIHNPQAFQKASESGIIPAVDIITNNELVSSDLAKETGILTEYQQLNQSSFATGRTAISIDPFVPRLYGRLDGYAILFLIEDAQRGIGGKTITRVMNNSELGQAFALGYLEDLKDGRKIFAVIPNEYLPFGNFNKIR